MDLAPDGFGSDKLDDGGHSANGFSFPREMELPPKSDLPDERASVERRSRAPQRPAVSAAATLPPIPSMPAAPPIPVATSEHDWFPVQPGSPGDHPLLRGLLLELPPRSGTLDKAWLDQWLEAARAVLELIYARGDGPGSRI